MSKIVKESGYRELSHIVKNKNKYYLVDSNDTTDAGYETMIFLYNNKEDEVESWKDLYCERYNTEEEMQKHHFEVCEDIEKYLKKNKTIEDYGGIDPLWYLTIKEEPDIDIRNYELEIEDIIEIKGNILQVLNKEQFNILRDKHIIDNFGNDGEVNFINLSGLFSLEEIKNKINEICKGE